MRSFRRLDREKASRNELHQVAVARFAGCEQHDAGQRRHLSRIAWRRLVAEIDGERAADNRLNADGRHLLREFERAEQIARIGQCERGLPVGLGKVGKPAKLHCALEQRVGRVHVQMDETRSVHALLRF